MSEVQKERRSVWRFFGARAAPIAIVCVFLLRGLILLCVVPPFEAWDEYQHLACIDYCAAHDAPMVYGITRVDPVFSHRVAQFPLPAYAVMTLKGFGGREYSQFWRDGPGRDSSRGTGLLMYEAQHPPLYYRLMAPIYRAAGGRLQLPRAVAVLRAVNLLFGAAALVAILACLRRLLPDRPGLAGMLGLCVALQPLLLVNTVRVANDALAFALGTFIVCICLTLSARRFALQTAALAVLIPLAVMTKATALVTLPLVVIAIAALIVQRQLRPRIALAGMAGVFAVATAFTADYFIANYRHFGLWMPMQEALANHVARRGFIDVMRALPVTAWGWWLWQWWVKRALWTSGWSFIDPPNVLREMHQLIIGGLALCVALAPRLRRLRERWQLSARPTVLLGVLLIATSAALLFHALESQAAWGNVQTGPWYAAIAMPWSIVLLGCAAHAVLGRRVAVVGLLVLAGVYLATEAVGLYRMIDVFGDGATLAVSLRRLDTLRPAIVDTRTLFAAQGLLAAVLVGLLIMAVRRIRAGRSQM